MTKKINKTKSEVSKRVQVVSLKVIKEKSIQYLPRKLSSPEDAVELCRQFLGDLPEERMILITLDTKLNFNSVSTISIGTISSSLVHPREVFKIAIETNSSSAIIVAHNHPSGMVGPSSEDIQVTERLVKSGEILGIPIIDHIIIGDEGRYYSFKEEGRL